MTTEPITALIVASWFPSYEDEAAGRFVADQAEALATTGAARPLVVSFDGARLSGGASSRGRQAEVVAAAGRAATGAATPLFVTPGWSVDERVPVLRLTIPEGQTLPAGAAHAAAHREEALHALADRMSGAVPNGPPAGSKAETVSPPGVVHAHTVYPDGAAATVLADRLGWPLVVTEHASFVDRIVATPVLRERYAAVLSRADRVLAVSEMLAAELRVAFPERSDKIAVLPNSVPLDLFAARPGIERTPDELLFVGYRKPSKGIENLLRAVAVARRQRPSIRLRLLGRSPDQATETRWLALAAELGLGEAVTFEEPVDRAGIAVAMGRASVFVHPSPRETFGVVVVEALASGLPVVATDSGGVTEILGDEPERLGALAPADDPEALGRAILRTLERRESYDPRELRASVERRFGSAFVAERLLVVYREVLASDRPARPPIDPGPTAAALPSRTIVIALDREHGAARLGPLPESIRRNLVLVTATEPAGVGLPAVGRVQEVAVDASWRPAAGLPAATRRPGLAGRLARLLHDPRGTIRRRLGHDAGSDASLAPATEAIRRLARELTGSDLLPVDGHDHLAIAALISDGSARPYPGGLRRLADGHRPARPDSNRPAGPDSNQPPAAD